MTYIAIWLVKKKDVGRERQKKKEAASCRSCWTPALARPLLWPDPCFDHPLPLWPLFPPNLKKKVANDYLSLQAAFASPFSRFGPPLQNSKEGLSS
jgi:hypothetical protein